MTHAELSSLPAEPAPEPALRLVPAPSKWLNHKERQQIQRMLGREQDTALPVFRPLIARLSHEQPVGIGSEKVAYDYRRGQVVILYFQPQDPRKLKQEFFERKVLHAVVPDHIPDIHRVATQPSLLIVDKAHNHYIEGPNGDDLEEAAKQEARSRLEAVGGYTDEYDRRNYAIDANGVAVYVDSPGLEIADPALHEAIRGLPEVRRITAERFLARLEAIMV